MHVDGFPVEKFKCRVSGTIEITEEEGTAMPLDRIVVMLVAARSDNFVPKIIEEDGTAMITRVVKLEHLALLEGDMRELALNALITGDNNALQTSLEFPEPTVDPTTGEVTQRPPVAAYAEPPDNDAVPPQNDAVPVQNDAVPPRNDAVGDRDFEYFDVPVATDDGTLGEKVVVGHIRGGDRETNVGSEPVDGPRAGSVSYADLEALGPAQQSAPGGGDIPTGERVGSVYPPGHTHRDQELRKFFEEDLGG